MEIQDANSFKNEYKRIAGKRSLYNTVINETMFLVLAGAVMHSQGIFVETQSRKDLRIHVLLVQPSRTGKGVSLKILEQASKMCDLTYADEVVLTDAGLVGQINPTADEQNKKKGLEPDDEGWQDPVIIGDLGIYDIISFSEGKQMIKLSTHSDDKLEILQSVMDTPGLLRKRLANGEISYTSNASIVSVTYFLDDFERIFLEQGIFQRMLIVVRKFHPKDWDNLHESLIEAPEISDKEFEEELRNFCQCLMDRIHLMPPGTRLRLDNTAKDFIRKKEMNGWHKFNKILKEQN